MLCFACGASCGSPPPPAPPPAPAQVHVDRACDVAPAAGLSWALAVEPRAIAEIPDLIPAIARVLPEKRMSAFAAAHGGVDPRTVEDLCVARYDGVILTIARTTFDRGRVERAFEERATRVETRAEVARDPSIVRLTGTVNGEPEKLALLGDRAIAYEQGNGRSVLRAAEAFALGKLKRARPALRSSALARASEVLGDAPVRIFAPGPFEGETAQGLGGLLQVTTAIAASARFAGPPARIAVRVVLTGAFRDLDAAAERFAAAANVLSESVAGRLFGLHDPIASPRVHVAGDALVLDATIDGDALSRGIHDALDAEVSEIMRR
jgi:hypothetical protein